MAGKISNNSAVLDVVTENADLTSILKENNTKETMDHSSLSSIPSTVDNSLVQSPSIESFSTMQDIENLSELNMDENSDLCIKIDNPQKHWDTLETYITFRITTKVARIEFKENEYIVRRRYNDFLWLRHKLLDAHPFCIIPPLPAKHSLIGQLDRYSKDFILVRMKALNVFISRIVQHPILSCNENFKLFITAKHPDFNLLRRQRTSNENRPHQNPPNVPHSVLKNKHLEFDRIKTYLTLLTEKINSVEKISSRINKERVELASELQYFYPIFITWSATEPELAKLLQSTASAIEKTMVAQNGVVANYQATVATPIKDFTAYVEVVQEALQKRESYQAVYEHSLDELNKKRTEKEKLVAVASANPTNNVGSGFSLWKQPSCDEKLEKLGNCIPQLVKKVELNQDNLECANEQLRSDVERWQDEKQQMLKKILLEFANKQVEYYEKSVSAWESVKDRMVSTAPPPLQRQQKAASGSTN
ncbi:PREDICTED: sorting nexin-7-like [Nicrophorus vespilloides]|uniref:Sorting nexin-7-like n=1 Tax=Nicrophorus vespilloides TaxID=110193 RepID=A0ABM1MN11_NICVS|nr:PREDICTED: sorting nexin-7-like [Nicrophorus vespilloides]